MCNRNSDKSDKYNKYGNSESCLQYLVHHALHQYCEQGGKYNFAYYVLDFVCHSIFYFMLL